MFLKLVSIILAIATLFILAILLGIGLILMLRFWPVAIIIGLFFGVTYVVSWLAGLEISFFPRF